MELQKINPEEFGLQEQQVEQIAANFIPIADEIKAAAEMYSTFITQEITPELCQEAKKARLKIRDIRTKGVEPIHKAAKAYHWAAGKYIDHWKNQYNTVIEKMEEGLSVIENHFVEIEKQKLEAFRIERTNQLIGLECSIPNGIELMDESAFNIYLSGAKEARRQKIEEQERIEKERVEQLQKDKEERENQRLENERLRLEAVEREQAIQEVKIAQEKQRLEAEAKIKVKEEEARKEKEQSERIIREANQKLADEQLARKKAEEEAAQKEQDRINAEAEERERSAALGDVDKFNEMKSKLIALVNSYSYSSKRAKNKQNEILKSLEK